MPLSEHRVYGYRTTGTSSFVDGHDFQEIINILGKRDVRVFLPLLETNAADNNTVQDIGPRSHNFLKYTTSDNAPVIKGHVAAYRLNGVDEAFDMPDHADFSFGADGTVPNEPAFSLGLAVRFNDVINSHLITRYDATNLAEEVEYRFNISGLGLPYFQIFDGGVGSRIGRLFDTSLDNDIWYILIATYDGSRVNSGCRIYINAVQVDDTDSDVGVYTAMENMSVATAIGYSEDAAGALEGFIDGDVALPFITGRCLSAADVLSLTNIYRRLLGL